MVSNVQCPVCTLYLLPGMDLSDHLETHPKEQVIKALVQLSLKSEVSETITPDNPKKYSNHQATPEKETTSLNCEISGNALSNSNQVTPVTIRSSHQNERKDVDDSLSVHSTARQMNISGRQCGGYVFKNISKSNSNSNTSTSSSNNNIYGPPTPFYDHQSQQQQSSQHGQPHSHHQSQQPQHLHQHHFHSFHGITNGCNSSAMAPGPTQPPMRLFSYQPPPKPLQPPPAYGAAISQLRSQNSQNLMVGNANRPLYPHQPVNFTSTSSSPTSLSLTTTPSRLPPPPPVPPPSLMPSFLQIDTPFTDACSNASAPASPRRPSTTPPMRPPPHLYRSPLSVSNGQFSRQSSSPFSTMAGSPSVLRYAESPVTAHYLERENGDFIVQETPKHVVECVEKDDGEFSVIERVYHMPPSVVQISEDQEDDDLSNQGSNSEDTKMIEDEANSGTWPLSRSPAHQGEGSTSQRQKKKPGITVLSDVQLDINEYLDLMGNIIASSKVAKTRTEMIKIEKFEPDDVPDEMDGSISMMDSDHVTNENMLLDNEQKDEMQQNNEDSTSSSTSSTVSALSASFADQSMTSGTTSVIRLAANTIGNKEIMSVGSPKSEDTMQATETDESVDEVVQEVVISDAAVDVQDTKSVEEIPPSSPSTADTPMEVVEEASAETKKADTETESVSEMKVEEEESMKSEPTERKEGDNKEQPLGAVCQDSSQQSSNSQEDKPEVDLEETTTTTPQKQPPEVVTIEKEHSAKSMDDEKPINKEDFSPNFVYNQSIKRPFKKTPKKLIIKPKNKEPPQSPIPKTRVTTPTPVSIPSTSQVIPPSPVESQEKEETTIPSPPSPIVKSDPIQPDDLNIIKSEPMLSASNSESIPTPLFADADEKLPPDDDIQPSTSNAIPLPANEEAILPCVSSEDAKPIADLSAFFGQCMKKEDVDDHPMHSIFGMDIDGPAETLEDSLSPSSAPDFPSASLFAKPLTSSEQLSLSESVLPDSSGLQRTPNHDHQPPTSSSYVEYPFCFMYGSEANQPDESKHNISPPIYCTEDFNKYSASTSGGNSASCTWYQSQSSENDFEIDGKGSYLDLDSCKRSASFATATEGSLPTSDALNIRTDEKMPAKGEISEQESNCGVENSWSQPLYNEFPVRFANPYQNFMSTHESWSHDNYFRPQDINSSVETNFSLRLSEQSSVMETLPSTSKRKNKLTPKVMRKKTFQCTHCNTHFPLLKEKNAHLIKQHGYKRVNRRLIRDPPTSTVTTATISSVDPGASLLFGLEPNALPPPPLIDEKDAKAEIKIEQESPEQKDCKKNLTGLTVTTDATPPTNGSISRTKYDSMRARDNRMLISFNLNALNVKNEGETHNYYTESKSSFCCFVCRKDFLTVKLFDEHLTEHPAECFTCHKKFTRWKNFMVHLKRHLGWKDFGCTYCEKKFVIRSALVEHMRMHTGQTPLKCKICGKSFKRYSNLTQHRKRHGTKVNRSKEYVCYCGEVLPSKARFIWHKETHDSKPKCCPYCRDRFVHANSLRRHIRLAHSEKFDYTEPMECPMCKQIYAKSSIKAHMATHSMDTQHECLICNKSFSTKWNLKIHNWVHANRATKPFKCEQCVKAFVREVDYNNHMNSHKQIKPYTCEHCGCKFIRKYNYIRHRREHHGNKKFTCDICGKLFHRHYYLIEHRRIHTGERPFQCTICGKSSTTKTNHNKHLKIHHSRDPFTSEA